MESDVKYYLIVCTCTGQIEPLAYMDDVRPGIHTICLRPVSDDDEFLLKGTQPDALAGALRRLSDHAVSITNAMHAIRCRSCGRQAEISNGNFVAIANHLAVQAEKGVLASVVVPESEPAADVVLDTGQSPPVWMAWQPPEEAERYIVPLSVLCKHLSGLIG